MMKTHKTTVSEQKLIVLIHHFTPAMIAELIEEAANNQAAHFLSRKINCEEHDRYFMLSMLKEAVLEIEKENKAIE